MASVNKAIIVGNLGRDPELKFTQDNTAVCTFSIATTDTWNDKNGDKQEKTEWHKCVAWNRLAEVCGQYLHKGKQVYVEGKLQTRKWEKDGQDHYSTEIVVREMKMLGTKADSGGDRRQRGPAGGEDPGPAATDQQPYFQPAPAESEDDELPF